MPYGLTPSLKKTFDALSSFVSRHGAPPTYRQLAELTGSSSTAPVHRKLKALEERGYIRRIPNKTRSIEIVVQPAVRPKPVVTSVALSRLDTDALVAELRRRGYSCEASA